MANLTTSLSVPGIYVIFRRGTEDCYVGQSVNIRNRWKTHRQDFKNHRHASRYMQRVFNKYGLDVFEFQLLETCSVNQLTDREAFWIEKLKPKYNACPAAGSCLGYKYSEETRQKHRLLMMGNTINVGREPWMKGRSHSQESKALISAKKKGTPGPHKGIPRTDDVKQKISHKKIGVPWSAARREAYLRSNQQAELSL